MGDIQMEIFMKVSIFSILITYYLLQLSSRNRTYIKMCAVSLFFVTSFDYLNCVAFINHF